MKSIQLIKQVNNTELGKGGTHETYILVPQDLIVSDLFETIGEEYSFIDKCSLKSYRIRLTHGREKRIVGMGQFYRDNNVCAGDKVILEKRVIDSTRNEYYISVNKAKNAAFFQKVKDYFEILTADTATPFLDKAFTTTDENTVTIIFSKEIQKRKDSPSLTKVYDIIVNGSSIHNKYQDRDMIGLKLKDGKVEFIESQPWKKYNLEVK